MATAGGAIGTGSAEPGGRWLELQRTIGRHLARRLFDELSRDHTASPETRARRVGWTRLLVYASATLIHALTLAFGVAGIFLLFRPWHTIATPFAALTLILLCVAARPRAMPLPYFVLDRAKYPTLYALADRIAGALSTKPVAGIAISANFDANYRQAGWTNEPYVELGAPLLAALSREERIAVIAHELSHGANGDPLRGRYLSAAAESLAMWALTARPSRIGHAGDRMPFGPLVSLLAVPFELLMLAASELVLWLAKGFFLLVLRQSQRAEYLADRLAASIAGSKESERALEKSYLFEIVQATIRAHALATPDDSLQENIDRAARTVAPEHMERLRSESLARQWQVDATHPPTALWVEMLRLRIQQPASGLLSEEELDAFDGEIERMIASQQGELINRARENELS